MQIIIRPFNHEDIPEIVNLHLKYLSTHFCTRPHSVKLLSLYYQSLSEAGQISYVAEVNGKMAGYICVLLSPKAIYLYQIKNHFFTSLLNFSAMIGCKFCHNAAVNLKFFWGRMKGLLTRNRQASDISQQPNGLPELRPIVVRPEFQGTSVARTLLAAVENDLLARGIFRYYLWVENYNLRAMNFYRKSGFVVKEEKGNVYVFMEKSLT
ncbi:MAG: GNAT family N-acetyltransferase [Deltaproteobacteria bacterium]|nr:GNAT family N-acetyltransferase [Deltaproteobacteria bacterium]